MAIARLVEEQNDDKEDSFFDPRANENHEKGYWSTKRSSTPTKPSKSSPTNDTIFETKLLIEADRKEIKSILKQHGFTALSKTPLLDQIAAIMSTLSLLDESVPDQNLETVPIKTARGCKSPNWMFKLREAGFKEEEIRRLILEFGFRATANLQSTSKKDIENLGFPVVQTKYLLKWRKESLGEEETGKSVKLMDRLGKKTQPQEKKTRRQEQVEKKALMDDSLETTREENDIQSNDRCSLM